MNWKTILVPHDFSSSANHAAAIARDEAKLHGSKLLLLHVIQLPGQLQPDIAIIPDATGAPISMREYAVKQAEAHLEDLSARLAKDGVTAQTFLRIGNPVEEILTFVTENAVDLIVMPHALEFTDDPHLMLREAYRVIRPEGQIVIAGFNPFSLYGAKRYFGRSQTPPWNGNFITLYRLKDWLTLLGFDVVGGRLEAYAPPFTSEKWLRRFGFFESIGDRWWPIAGGVYFLRATKKVLGMRVLTPAWQRRERRKKALAPARAREGLTTSDRLR